MKKPTIRMRKPPTRSAADVEAFVVDGGPKGGRTRASGKAMGPSDVFRPKRGTVLRRVTVYLPPETARQFHAVCVRDGTTMSATIEKWVADHIARIN